MILFSSFASLTNFLKIPSAAGERQMFPIQTNKTLGINKLSLIKLHKDTIATKQTKNRK